MQQPATMDAREQHFRIASADPALSLFLRYQPADRAQAGGKTAGQGSGRRVVLYVHGATFPSALSVAHRFDGRSWRDELTTAGFHVWGLDFLGYGGSDRYPAMAAPPDGHAPLCNVEDASRQIEDAVRFICRQQDVDRVSIIAHSWGTLATGRFASRCPALVDRLVLFGAIARRDGPPAPDFPAWRAVSVQDQWDRFTAEVPVGAAPVLSARHFAAWGEAYLDSDPLSRQRTPPAVATPAAPWHDIARAWAGELGYEPGEIRAPVLLVRGEWDSMCTDADARWLFERFTASPMRRDVKIGRGTHLMHLEARRYELYRVAQTFLEGLDTPCEHADP